MDGSGRVSLRNRQFLRRIEPFFARSNNLQSNVQISSSSSTEMNSEVQKDVSIADTRHAEHEEEENIESQSLRRSSRVTKVPDRYQA